MAGGREESAVDAEMPEDAVAVKQAGPLEFYFSRSEHLLLVRIPGCQAAPVRLARTEIADLLNIFDQQTREKETRLLADLESDEDDF